MFVQWWEKKVEFGDLLTKEKENRFKERQRGFNSRHWNR